jgi:hypothetical protein
MHCDQLEVALELEVALYEVWYRAGSEMMEE